MIVLQERVGFVHVDDTLGVARAEQFDNVLTVWRAMYSDELAVEH